MDCNFIDLELHVKTGNAAELAAWLPQQGGLFAEVCRQAVCPQPQAQCTRCARSRGCDWQRVFGQSLAFDPEALRRHQKPPLPFAFAFPLRDEAPIQGGRLVCGLVVVGGAIAALGMLLEGFSRLLARWPGHPPAELDRLYARDYQGMALPLDMDRSGTPHNLSVLSLAGMRESCPWNANELDIRLLSPLKLRVDGHLVRQFDFGLFARSILRRVSALVYYYEQREAEDDFRSLSRMADGIGCTRDAFYFDDTPNGSRKQAGIRGQGRFRGEFTELMPFLLAGMYFQAGRQSSFGMGRYRMNVP